jgi:hypothetical protein
VGCKDEAEPDYAKCVQLAVQNRIADVWGACNDAIDKSPRSTSGKAAAVKLAELKPQDEAPKTRTKTKTRSGNGR